MNVAEEWFSLRDRSTGEWVNQDQIRELKRFDDFVTIDWVEDQLANHKDSLLKNRNMKLFNTFKNRFLSFAMNWLVLALMGLIIGLIAGCLNIITAWLGSLRFGYCSNGFYLSRSFCCWAQAEDQCSSWNNWSDYTVLEYFLYILMSMVLSLSAVLLVKCYAPTAAGSGISEIKCIVSGFAMRGFLGWWTLLIKSLGLPLAISSGLSVGKEGPSVHYAVCVGNSVARLFDRYKKSASKAREFLTATSAAGVAVAFGSPMGGVLFSMEEISNVFELSTIIKSYFCSLMAVGMLAALNPFRTGQLVMFEVVYDTNWHYFEIPVYIILGAFGGIYGIVVSRINIRVVAFRKKYLANYAIREVLILASFTALICYFNEFLRWDMTESMQILFHECDSTSDFNHIICSADASKLNLVVSLLFATVMRMFLTIITYGCKVPAGIFVPSMAAGATFGRALGIIMDSLYQNHKQSSIFGTCSEDKCIIPGTYAFLGAAAALSGITHLTVTVAVIMFELTGALRYIIPTMIVISITKIINDKWGKGGIADQMIKFNGLPHIDPKEERSFNTNVTSAMTLATVTLPSKSDSPITVKKIRKILEKTDHRGFPLVDSEFNPKITGYITRLDIQFILDRHQGVDDSTRCNFLKPSGPGYDSNTDQIDFSSIVNPCPLTISSATTLDYVLDMFVKLGPRYILVEEEGLLVGMITRKDILRYEYSLHALHEQEDDQVYQDQFDDKVWQFMALLNRNFRKNLGKVFHNDGNRYL